MTEIIAKHQPPYLPLPARVGPLCITCCWQLSWRERLKLLLTGRLWHKIMNFGEPLQPQKLQVDRPRNLSTQ